LPFRDADRLLRDIRRPDDRDIHRGMDFEAFREDPKTVAAVERKLQVISEAAIRLGSDADAYCPGLSWRDIRGMATGYGTSTTGLNCL